MATETQPISSLKRKKIMILICEGGGGHMAAGEALKQILSDSYDIELVNVLDQVVHALDPLHFMTGGKFSGEDLYNFLLQRHLAQCIDWMSSYGTRRYKKKKVERSFSSYFNSKPKPDLIISITPWINGGVIKAAEKNQIPFLLIPTDLDGSTFLYGFPEHASFSNFKIALAYDDPALKSVTLQRTAVPSESIAITGFPVRPACQKKYTAAELARLRTEQNLLEGYSTGTLIMGALGGNLILQHTKTLATFDPRIHDLKLQFNICTGKNREIATKIASHLERIGGYPLSESSYRLPTGVVFHIRGFTKEILEIMATSDFIITKTGSCTVNEAIYLGKPVLLDNTPKSTARHLRWEQFNIPFVERHHLGSAFTDSRQLLMLIPSLLKFVHDPKEHPLEIPSFSQNVRKLVGEMLLAERFENACALSSGLSPFPQN